MKPTAGNRSLLLLLLLSAPALAVTKPANATGAADGALMALDTSIPSLDTVTVTARRLLLIGTATTASDGVVVGDELSLTPAYRPGQILETVPGLVVTLHSGEGKANQYLLRGYNLDHGTDLAVSVDGMPVNEPSHAHGQGYTDLNFLIPELASEIRYTKGTYHASEGDFASVGAIHLGLADTIEDEATITAGTLGFQRTLLAGSTTVDAGHVLGALELQHYDGPFDNPDDQRKINAVLRLTAGDGGNGYSLTGMFYHGLWNNTTDQPRRALDSGLIGRYGSLDPSDGGQAQRASLTGQYFRTIGAGQLTAHTYLFSNRLTFWSNFTHDLVDPINGDQEEQHEDRIALGGAVDYSRHADVLGFASEGLVGFQGRYDFLDVSRTPSRGRQPIPVTAEPLGFSEIDRIHLASNAAFAQATIRWTTWFRAVLGLREDLQHGSDTGTNAGSARQGLFQPKASLIVTPAPTMELYLSAGRGFHSDDLRGVTQARISATPGAPLLARQTGEEIGVRQALLGGRVAIALAIFNLEAQSETTYNPDVGQDFAGPPSRRAGYELNATWQARPWLEFYGSFSQDRARFTRPFDDGTGHVGRYLPNAPFATGSFSAYLKNLGPWSGGLEYRYLGAYPLSSDDVVRGSGYGEWNGQLRCALADGWTAGLGVYNIFNIKADAMEYWYVDRLRGEAAGGVPDVHFHPLEPISVRLTLSRRF